MTQQREHTAAGDRIDVREVDIDDREGDWWAIRMPISSTAEARDGKAFTRERLDNWVRQINDGTVPVFADHGKNDDIADSRYSFAGKLGFYQNAEVETRDDVADLVADAVVLDPASVPDEAAQYRAHLAILRTQAEAGMPITASVGWQGDDAEADLLEGSIVGIPSDTRADATAGADATAMARAVSAASSDFDVATFVRELTSGDRNVVEVGGEEIDLTPPDAVQNAATVALAKDDELEPDCGTGAGRESARQIAGDSVTAERIDDIAAYLTSHEEDVSADGPPSDWSDEEWQDCGNLQYALWGGTGTGTGLEWAQSKANEVADAQGDELPYDRARNLDDPDFGEGDAVEWTSNDVTVRGRVADVGDEFSPAEGVTITGDEGEAVYLIHELDDSLEPPQYRRENVAKPESSLDESQAELPPLDGNFADEDNSMTDENTEPDGESGTETDDEQTRMEMAEFMERMVEMQEEQTEMLREMYGDKEGDDMDEESADEADVDEHDAADDSEERTVTLDGDEKSVDEVRDMVADLRDQLAEADDEDLEDLEDPATRDYADEEDAADEADDSERSGFGMAARMED